MVTLCSYADTVLYEYAHRIQQYKHVTQGRLSISESGMAQQQETNGIEGKRSGGVFPPPQPTRGMLFDKLGGRAP